MSQESNYCTPTPFFSFLLFFHFIFYIHQWLVLTRRGGSAFWKLTLLSSEDSNDPSAWNQVCISRGGWKRLPKFKWFSAKFPIGLHVILQIQIKKFENDFCIMWKIILNRKSVEVQPCTPLEIMLNGFRL